MSSAKSASKPKERNVPLERAPEEVARRFRKRWGRPFGEEDVRRLHDGFGDAPKTASKARRALMVLAGRVGSAMATGNAADAATPIDDYALAEILLLLGFVELKGTNVSELVDRERANFAKLRERYFQLQIPPRPVLEAWAARGFAKVTGPKMLAALAAQGLALSEHRPGKTKLDLAQDVLDDLKAIARREKNRRS